MAQESSWVNARSQKLHQVTFQAAQPLKGIICFHHGYAEHVGRYYNTVFPKLAEKGLAVHTYDAHAHGRSEPLEDNKRVFISKFSHLVDDFLTFIADTKKLYDSSVACFLFGHSIGGLVCVHTVLREPAVCRGMVLSSPALHVQLDFVQSIQVAVCRLFARLTPGHRLAPALDVSWISDDPADVQRYQEDPLIDKGKFRAATAATFLDALHEALRRDGEITVPLLVFHADQDRVTDIQGSKRLFEQCKSSDKVMEIVHSTTHELLLHAKQGPPLISLVGEWMVTRCTPGSPAGKL